MTQEDRKLMLESLYDLQQIQTPSNIDMAVVPLVSKKENLFKDPMQKQVERVLKAYEASHPDAIPFKSLNSENWLLDISEDGTIRLKKRLGGALSKSIHAFDDTGIVYFYRNITIGLAVHDYTSADSASDYYWYFITREGIGERNRLYYLCSAYYAEFGITNFLLKHIGELSKL